MVSVISHQEGNSSTDPSQSRSIEKDVGADLLNLSKGQVEEILDSLGSGEFNIVRVDRRIRLNNSQTQLDGKGLIRRSIRRISTDAP